MGGGISYNDVLSFCENISGGSKFNGSLILSQEEVDEANRLICFDNHYFNIIKLPEFKICFLSPTIKDVLGYEPYELTLKKIYSLIHPDDYERTLKSTIHMLDFAFKFKDKLEPFKNVLSIEFRIKHKKGFYKRILSQNCIFNTGPEKNEFKALSFNTDVSFYHEYLHGDTGKSIRRMEEKLNIPDRKINFTLRELEILRLLALGNSSEQIGNLLNISKHTVDTHRRKMLAKSGLSNSAELIAFALLHKVLETAG